MITVFGLTGGIACGKSTVTKVFRANGVPIVDADIVARQVVELGKPGLQEITKCFGEDYLNEDGTLNRAKLGDKVFHDRIAMYALNSIMTPLLKKEVQKQFTELFYEGHRLIGYDAALIIEMGHADRYRPLIVVNCPFQTQIDRLIKRNNLTYEQAKARIDAQIPLSEKVKLADYVIDTSGTLENSEKQTLDIISKLKSDA
jgi:dephospho-CoA kinase